MPSMSAFTDLDDLNIPLYERIRLDIQSKLVTQVWAPDEPIPTEQELAQQYGVSVGTVRKGIERLVQDGLLSKIQGKGTFIKRPDFKNSLLRFFRYRDDQGQQVIPSSLIKSVQRSAPNPLVNQQLQLPPTASLIQLKRLRVLEAEIVLSESIWLPEDLFAPLLQIDKTKFANLLYPFYYDTCQQFVLSAKETLSFSADHEDSDLGASQGDLLVKIERTAYNMEGLPIEYRVSYGQPQHFRYEVRIS